MHSCAAGVGACRVETPAAPRGEGMTTKQATLPGKAKRRTCKRHIIRRKLKAAADSLEGQIKKAIATNHPSATRL